MTEGEIVGWHHGLNGHECEQVPGVGEGQGSLACCSPCGHKESDTTERLNNSQVEDAVLVPKQGSDSPNRDQIPRTGIRFMPPAVEPCSPNHWTTREVPLYGF